MNNVSRLFDQPSITPEVQNSFDTLQKELKTPFIPNFFQVWAHAPLALDGIWPAMSQILTKGSVERLTKEMAFIAISSLRDCPYCETAHHLFCKGMGLPQDQIDDLIQNHTASGAAPEVKAAIDFIIRLVKNSHSATQEDLSSLKKHGYSTEQIMELMAMSGLGVFYTQLADVTQIIVDEPFQQMMNQAEQATA